MKTLVKALFLIFTSIMLFAGCQNQLVDEPNQIPKENITVELHQTFSGNDTTQFLRIQWKNKLYSNYSAEIIVNYPNGNTTTDTIYSMDTIISNWDDTLIISGSYHNVIPIDENLGFISYQINMFEDTIIDTLYYAPQFAMYLEGYDDFTVSKVDTISKVDTFSICYLGMDANGFLFSEYHLMDPNPEGHNGGGVSTTVLDSNPAFTFKVPMRYVADVEVGIEAYYSPSKLRSNALDTLYSSHVNLERLIVRKQIVKLDIISK